MRQNGISLASRHEVERRAVVLVGDRLVPEPEEVFIDVAGELDRGGDDADHLAKTVLQRV